MSKYLPHGTTVTIGSQLIGGLISVSIPDRSKGEAEITDSDSGGDREWIAGLRDGGNVEITMRHDPDDLGQIALETNYNAIGGAEVEEIVITLPAAATALTGSQTYTFDAFVTAALHGDLGLEADEAAEQTATLRVDGAVTIA